MPRRISERAPATVKKPHFAGQKRNQVGTNQFSDDGFEFDWWDLPQDQIGYGAYAIARRIHRQQLWRLNQMRRNVQIFDGFFPTVDGSFNTPGYSVAKPMNGPGNRMPSNYTRPVIETAVSVITKGDVKATAMTSDGDWGLQQKAKEINRFSEGAFYHSDMRVMGPRLARDSCIFPRGLMQCVVENDDLKWHHVLANEVLVDDSDGIYGEPRCIYRKHWSTKDELIRRFPKSRAGIDQAQPDSWDSQYSRAYVKVTELYLWVEAWRRPSVPGADDGVYAAGMRDCTLAAKPWKISAPIASMVWEQPHSGWYGTPLMDSLRPLQQTINTSMRALLDTMRLGSPQVWVKAGSKIPKNFFTNEVLGVGFYAGDSPPTYFSGAQINPQQITLIDRKIDEMYEKAGVSRQEARAMAPTDTESAIAVREKRDIGTQRLAVAARNYEQLYLDATKIHLDMTRVAHEEGQRIIVQSPGIRGFKTVDSSVVAALAQKDYAIKLSATSLLPSTPEGKLAMLTDMLEAGILSQSDARLYLGGGDNPDIDSTIALQNAPYDSILAEAEWILDGNEARMPDPFMPLDDGKGGPGLGIQIMKWTYLRARTNGAGSSPKGQAVLDQLNLWIVTAVAMVQSFGSGATPLTMEPNTSANVPNGAPQANGAPPPVSPLLPGQGVTPPAPIGA